MASGAYGENSWLGQPRDGDVVKMIYRTAIAATIGGSASSLTGGQIANGAVPGAMQHLFNDEGVRSESPQEKIDRLVTEVLNDYPDLILGGQRDVAVAGSGVSGDASVHGHWSSQGVIEIAYEGRPDSFIQGIIFHELLHVDQANYVSFGNRILYKTYSAYFEPGGHNKFVTAAGQQYSRQAAAIGHGDKPTFVKPNLDDAPWR